MKVVVPCVEARVEQRHKALCQWIDGSNMSLLGSIARTAGKRKIRLIGCAATRTGHRVLKLESIPGDSFGSVTVLAPVAGSTSNKWIHLVEVRSLLHCGTRAAAETTGPPAPL